MPLSTTCGGVATLPQSCSHAARYSSYLSSSFIEKSLNLPSFISATASASIIVITGTLAQCPPVYSDFLSIAVAINLMNDSKSTFNSSTSLLLVRATAPWEARDSTCSFISSLKLITSPFSFCALINCITPIISFS